MDSFQVKAKDTSVLDQSHLVEEMRAEASNEDMFPVLIDGQIGYFHRIDGGYSRAVDGSGGNSGQPRSASENGYHVVNLIHRVQGPDSPPNKIYSDTIEVHLGENYYHLEVADIWQMGEYPDENFVLSLKVTGYMNGPYSFSEAMGTDIDKREEEYSANGDS